MKKFGDIHHCRRHIHSSILLSLKIRFRFFLFDSFVIYVAPNILLLIICQRRILRKRKYLATDCVHQVNFFGF